MPGGLLSSVSPGGGGGGGGGAQLAAGATATAAAAVAESSLGPRCKKRESRRAAFGLLAALCRGEEEHLRQTVVLLGGRDLVTKAFLSSSDDGDNTVTATVDGRGGADCGSGGGAGAAGEETRVVGSDALTVVGEEELQGVASGEPWDYDPKSVLKESGQHVGLQNQVPHPVSLCVCVFGCFRAICACVCTTWFTFARP